MCECTCAREAVVRFLCNQRRDGTSQCGADADLGEWDCANSQTHRQIGAAAKCGTAGVVKRRWGLSHVSTV